MGGKYVHKFAVTSDALRASANSCWRLAMAKISASNSIIRACDCTDTCPDFTAPSLAFAAAMVTPLAVAPAMPEDFTSDFSLSLLASAASSGKISLSWRWNMFRPRIFARARKCSNFSRKRVTETVPECTGQRTRAAACTTPWSTPGPCPRSWMRSCAIRPPARQCTHGRATRCR